MAIRLLSFLSDIESALLKQSAADMGPTWTSSRVVNYHQGLARMILNPSGESDGEAHRGAILLQTFLLADGSLCLKAKLSWDGSDSFPVVAVYSRPQLDWRIEAAQIASQWLAGPPATTRTMGELAPMAAMAG